MKTYKTTMKAKNLGNKVLVSAYQSKLTNIEKIEECKDYWKKQLEKL